jgi:hypothetical protein
MIKILSELNQVPQVEVELWQKPGTIKRFISSSPLQSHLRLNF